MKVRILEDSTRTSVGVRKEKEIVDLPMPEAISLIRLEQAEPLDPWDEPSQDMPFKRINGMMKRYRTS